MTGAQLAAAARALVGVPFRLHGRDPRYGLDCVGLLDVALSPEPPLPNGYALRCHALPDLDMIAGGSGLRAADGSPLPGDVLMLCAAPCQIHLAIAADPPLFVHAHAGLRKVVLGPLRADWPVLAHWRLDQGH